MAYGRLEENLFCFHIVWSYSTKLKANLLWALLLLYYRCLLEVSTAHCLMVKYNSPELEPEDFLIAYMDLWTGSFAFLCVGS